MKKIMSESITSIKSLIGIFVILFLYTCKGTSYVQQILFQAVEK